MKKFSVVVDCPIDTAINVLKGKCKAGIVLKIQGGYTRYSALRSQLDVSEKLLGIQLGELIEDGIVVKERVEDNPLQTSYGLTPDGIGLCNIIRQLRDWGIGYKLYERVAIH